MATVVDLILLPFKAWWRTISMQGDLRRAYPDGGHCQICGEETGLGERQCAECGPAGAAGSRAITPAGAEPVVECPPRYRR